MEDAPAKVAQATAKALSDQDKKPPPLTRGEKIIAGVLLVAGLAVIGLTIFAFSTTDSGFTFKQKEKTVPEPVAVIVPPRPVTPTKSTAGRSRREKRARRAAESSGGR